MTPHPTSGSASFSFEVLVLVSKGSDCVSVSDEPFPNVFAVARHGANHAAVLVVSLDLDSDVLTADRLNQCTLDAPSLIEPIAVLVFRQLIPLGRVEAGKTYVVPGYLYPVTIGHICLAGDRAPGPFLRQALEEEEKKDCRDGKDSEEFHCSSYSGLLPAVSIMEKPIGSWTSYRAVPL